MSGSGINYKTANQETKDCVSCYVGNVGFFLSLLVLLYFKSVWVFSFLLLTAFLIIGCFVLFMQQNSFVDFRKRSRFGNGQSQGMGEQTRSHRKLKFVHHCTPQQHW